MLALHTLAWPPRLYWHPLCGRRGSKRAGFLECASHAGAPHVSVAVAVVLAPAVRAPREQKSGGFWSAPAMLALHTLAWPPRLYWHPLCGRRGSKRAGFLECASHAGAPHVSVAVAVVLAPAVRAPREQKSGGFWSAPAMLALHTLAWPLQLCWRPLCGRRGSMAPARQKSGRQPSIHVWTRSPRFPCHTAHESPEGMPACIIRQRRSVGIWSASEHTTRRMSSATPTTR